MSTKLKLWIMLAAIAFTQMILSEREFPIRTWWYVGIKGTGLRLTFAAGWSLAGYAKMKYKRRSQTSALAQGEMTKMMQDRTTEKR
jgi:hypothetical protein